MPCLSTLNHAIFFDFLALTRGKQYIIMQIVITLQFFEGGEFLFFHTKKATQSCRSEWHVKW